MGSGTRMAKDANTKSGSDRDADRKREKQGNYKLKDTVEKNLSVYCAVSGVSRTEFVNEALVAALRQKGLDPDKEPQIVGLRL